MLFRPGMTWSGARQPGAARSRNIYDWQLRGQKTKDSQEPPAARDRFALRRQRWAGRSLRRGEHRGLGYIDGHVNLTKSQALMTLPARAAKTFTISELAREFDITPRAIRFYEDSGLLEPARVGRNRVYSQRDRTRLKLTLRGKRLGFSLQEIRGLVTMYDTDSDTAPQLQAFLAVLGAHRRQLELQLEDIRVTLDELTLHEGRCHQLLTTATAAVAPAAQAAPVAGAASAPARRKS